MDVFLEIRRSVDVSVLFSNYGISVNSKNQARCPFHGQGNERTPSLKVYHQTNSWYCFGCGAGGSAIDFVMTYHGLSPIDAAKELDSIYQLSLFHDKPLSEVERERLHEAEKQRRGDRLLLKNFDEWEHTAFIAVANYLKFLEKCKSVFAPKSPNDELHPLFMEACHNLDFCEEIFWKTFINGDFSSKLEFYNHYREVVTNFGEHFNNLGQSPNAA